MAIRLIQGKIGSGKTYYAVQHVIKNYYTWCNETDSWIPKQRDREIKIFTNIQNFKVGYDLDHAVKEAGGLSVFFSCEYQKQLSKTSNNIYIIDEAQNGRYFHRKFYDVGVFLFFQMHRHYGVDIYLITQDARCLARELQDLSEYTIKAVRRSNTIGGYFVYKFFTGNDYKDECFKTKRIKKDQRIFRMYQSMMAIETEKVKSVTFKHIIYFCLLIGLAFLVFRFGFYRILIAPGKKISKHVAVVEEKESLSVQKVALEPKTNQFRIVGLISDEFYLVRIPGKKKLVRVKIDKDNIKKVGDYVIVEGME